MDTSAKLVVREASAQLAFALYKHYNGLGSTSPAVIGEWEAICHADEEYAEIRNQWIDS